MMKRIVSMLLCLLMVVGVVAPSVSAAQPIDYGNGLTSDDVYFGEGSNIIYNDDGSFTVNSSDKGESLSASSDSAKAPVSPVVPEELGEASATVGDTTVDALGVPKDSSLTIQEAKPETESAIDQVVANQDGTSSELFRYDISVQDKNGLDWQPNGMVRLELDAGKPLHKNQKVYVVHVSDDGEAERIDARVNAAGKIEFETEGFSTFAGFTVDFEYENAKFSINGLTSILLSEVFKSLNMPLDVEDVKDVTFTDYSLISIEKQGADWKLTSLKAFQTTEALTMTMKDGQVYEIKVTDAITTMANFYEAYYGGDAYNYIDGYVAGGNAVVQLFLNSSGSPTSNDNISRDFDTQPLVIDGRGVGGCMEIVLQKASGAGNTLVWDLVQLKITGGAKVVIRLGNSFSGTETVTINSVQPYSSYAARPLFDIYDGSLYFNLGSDDASLVPSGTGLNVQSESSVKQIIFDGNDLGASASVPLIYHRQGKDEDGRQNLVMRGVTFKDAKHRAVLVQTNNMTNLRFRDCTFSSTVRDVDYGGGAIYIDGGTDTSYNGGVNVVDVAKFGLYNCTFSGNTGASGHGGAIACYGDVHTLDIDGCKFENCTSANRAGAIEFSVNTKTQNNNIYDSFRIKDTTFSNCTASSHGGAIDISNGDNPLHLAAGITITGCTFTDCNAKNRGGAIRLVVDQKKNLTINNSGFSGCIAGSWGGAVSVQGVIGNVSITGSKTDTTNGNYTFKGCSGGARGGAFCFDCTEIGNVTLTSAIFRNNVSHSIGGGIHVGINHDTPDTVPPTVGAVKVESCTFEGNEADGVGGGIALTEGTYASITVKDSSFTECFSSNYGGGIAIKVYKDGEAENRPLKVTGAILIQGCTFDKCTSGALSPEPLDTDGDGKGDKTTWDHDGDPSTAEIIRLNGVGGGGAIAIGAEVATSITIKDTTKDEAIEFQNCYTWNNGGAICFLQTIKTPLIKLENLDIDKCRARDAGGAIHLSNLIANDLKMDNCKITNCSYFSKDFVLPDVLKNTHYNDLGTKTYAAYDASGTFRSIGNTTCQATISGCHFESNWSYSNGGGVYWNANNIRNGAPVTKDGVTTTPQIKPSLLITGTTFKDNIAERDGGGVYVEATVDIDDCDFESNEAWGRGGAIAQQVYNNEARQLGAGEATNLILDAATEIWNNHAVHGGGISITVSNTVSLQKGTDGKYINYPVKFQLGGATVRDNWASGNGGGIYYATTAYEDEEIQKKVDHFQKEILIDNGQIYGNKTGCDTTGKVLTTAVEATQHGGGIYMSSNQVNTDVGGYSNITISKGSIHENYANSGNGGGVYMTGENALCVITGGTITRNKAIKVYAGGNGGGIAISGGARIEMNQPYLYNEDGTVKTEKVDGVDVPMIDKDASGGSVTYNTADVDGGGIWLEAVGKNYDGYTFTINEGSISNNESAAQGGGIAMYNKTDAIVYGGSISKNTAEDNGGGLFAYLPTTITISGGTISGNTATEGQGGGIYAGWYGLLKITDGTVEGNKAPKGVGGGIYTVKLSLEISGGTIQKNQAVSGGGICVDSWTTVSTYTTKISGSSSIINNEASDNGGGIYVVRAPVEITGGTIGDNKAAQGAGLYADTGSTTTMNGGEISGNAASSMGGGIYATTSDAEGFPTIVDLNGGQVDGNGSITGYVKIDGTTEDIITTNGGGVYVVNGAKINVSKSDDGKTTGNVINNEATYGGGIYAEADTEVTVSGGNVDGNTATVNGGGIYGTGVGTIDVSSGNISNNHANSHGGGVYITNGKVMDVTDGNIYGNTCNNRGGGVCVYNSSKLTVSGNLYNNTAAVNGGGIYAQSKAIIEIKGDLYGNTATSGQGGGAYIANGSHLTITGTVGKEGAPNKAGTDGGGVCAKQANGDTLSQIIIGKNVEYNEAANGGGIAVFSGANVTVNGGSISHNKASSNGGGIYADNATVALNTVDANGNAVEITASDAKIGKLLDNTATGGNGGGAYLTGGATLTVHGYVGEVDHPNSAPSGAGGGLYATGANTKADIYGSVQYNTALNGGGAAAASSAVLTVDGGNIYKNTATGNGGGAYATDSGSIILAGGNIDANTAAVYGGGAYAQNTSTITVTGGNVSNNISTTGNGGGLHVHNSSTATISGGSIYGNTATATTTGNGYGGGVHAYQGSTVTVSGGNIYSNTATYGGGISADEASTITLFGSIYQNTAENGGGAAVAGGSTLTVNGGKIENNRANTNGGGIYANGGIVEILTYNGTSGLVQSNTAATSGGGIYSKGASTITLNGNLYSNVAEGSHGGGAYVAGGTITVNGNIGAEGKANTAAKGYGGGLCVTKSCQATINGFVIYNEAKYGAGATSDSNAVLNINGHLDNNTATSLGGGAYVNGATLNINKVVTAEGTTVDGTVDNNKASFSGGGIYAENGSTVKVDGHMYCNTANGSRDDNCGGGAIYQSGGTLTVDGIIGGSEANANKAPNGRGGGVLVTNGCTGTVEGSVTYNEAFNGGGVGAFENAQLTIDGYLDHNAASQNGGGAVVGSGATLNINGHMDNNSAANNGGGALVNGGILNVNRVGEVDGTVDGNIAADSGGGIMATNATIKIYGNLSNNVATSGNGGGASVESGTKLTIIGSVHHNTATNSTNGLGGGIYATGANTVATVEGGGNIYQNTARNGGGAACRNGGKVVVNGGNVQNNTANSGGGGIHCFDALVEIQSGNIQNNYSKQFAGGMYVGGASTASVTGSVLNNVTDGNGGGIHCASTDGRAPTLTVNGNVEGNKAVTHGGGIYAMTSDGNVGPVININNGSILNNHANCTNGNNGTYDTYTTKASKNDGFGGGVYLSDATLTLTGQQNEDGTFVNGMIQNNSAVNGGGIYAIDANITITGGIRGNKAEFVATDANKDTVLMGLGGGLCAYSKDGTSTITLTGNIDENTAQVFGGGAYIEGSGTSNGTTFGANFTQNSGYIYGNKAIGRNGGGLLVSGNAIANIKGGIIRSNKALNGYGGGVHAYNGGHIVITGGSILLNEAKRGGGIAAEINAYVEFTNTVSMVDDGGSLSQNKATEYGGGIYAEASTVKVSGGTIDSNTARYGGGIAAVSEISFGASSQTAAVADVKSSVTVEGGAITGNFAECGGGVYAKDAATAVIVRGGNIVSNQARKDYADPDLTKDADGSGGGIYVDNASVQVNKPNATAAAGMVTANEAARGGGVYVTNGGDLTVQGGYIINNLAHGNEGKVGTALAQGDALKAMVGIGGGIFVADGTAGNASTFTLLAQDETTAKAPVAIFGNLADYAADDVFANGVNTDLNVPLVTQMDLAGYPFQPGGWFEDYPIDDPSYESGLNGGKSMGIENGNVYRYRGSAVIYRIEIAPSVLNDAASLPANKADRYVCMTLGIPGAVGEEIVLDFGLNADMELLDNDLVIKDNYYLTTNLLIGKNHPFGGDNKPLEYQNLYGKAPSDFDSELEGYYGTLTVTSTKNADGTLNFKVTYKLYNMKFIGVETFTYAVCYQDIWYYADVKIIPASVIYFEEGYVKAEDGKWTYVPDGSSDETNADVTQDGDRPGEDIGNALGNLDMDNVYGYDSHYVQNNKYSMGVALMTTVCEGKDATATFEFWGTGFDVISLCSNKSGAIMVTVKRLDKTGVKDRYLMVDTYYSYTYKDGKWSVSTQSDDNATYQIPVMSVTDLEYGKYSVEIYVAYENFVFDHGQYNGAGKYDFYLDAIRIYDPVNYKDPYEKDNEGNNTVLKDGMDTILNAYDKDGEYAPTYAEIRDLILGKAQCDTLGKIPTPGALFIDGGHEVKDYISYGPNNELYLDKGESLIFTITKSASLAKVQLAMKSLGGAVKVTITDTDGITTKTIKINTATDLYYDISEFIGKKVVLTNASEDNGALLSITNKKVTYKYDNGSGASMEGGDFVVDGDTANDALRLLGGTLADPKIKIENASVAMEDEVKYNFYFSLSDASNVVEKGILIFDEKLADGTIYDASQVIPGAVAVGEQYMVTTDSIPAKNMGDMVYFKIYVKLSDGSYAYTDVVGYNVVAYAKSVLKLETASAKSKALMVALLNYGAEAQKYFGYNTDNLMNAELTAEQQALVEAYDSSKISGLVSADPAKTGSFESTGSFGSYRTSACFEGAFSINYYVTPTVDAEVTMYYWTKADYEAAEELTVENATGAIVVTEGAATVSGIAAKEMEDTMYVAMVSEVDGVRYCSGVMAYSMATYCKSIANSDGAEMQALAQATLVYGGCAKGYFG